MLAFVDENLSDNEAKALQSKLEKIPGAADCTFVSPAGGTGQLCGAVR